MRDGLWDGVHNSPRSHGTWIKNLSFCTTTWLMSLAFIVESSQNSVRLVTHLSGPAKAVRTVVSPTGLTLGSQLLMASRPRESRMMGISPQLLRAFLGEFPSTPSQDLSHLKLLSGGRKGVWQSWWTPRLGELNQRAHDGSSIPTEWTLHHSSSVPPGSS